MANMTEEIINELINADDLDKELDFKIKIVAKNKEVIQIPISSGRSEEDEFNSNVKLLIESGKLELLPNGKPHVSFSEIKDWKECSYRHYLKNVKKIEFQKPSPYLDFGIAIHTACEKYLNTGVMNVDIAHDYILAAWEKNKDHPDYNNKINSLKKVFEDSKKILEDIPEFMSTTFPGWELEKAEFFLYEETGLEKHIKNRFKGYIDLILKVKKKDKVIYWILDWKTSTSGWRVDKKKDEMVKAQVVFYKNFWSKKMNIDPKDVRCGFIILKRSAKAGKVCELFPVSVGEVTTAKSLTVLNNMLTSMKRNIKLKNKSSCKYCDYYNTTWCTQ